MVWNRGGLFFEIHFKSALLKYCNYFIIKNPFPEDELDRFLDEHDLKPSDDDGEADEDEESSTPPFPE